MTCYRCFSSSPVSGIRDKAPDLKLVVVWASREATQTVADQVCANIDYFFAGNPTNLVSG